MSKVLVICAKRYNGHELWTLLGVLQQRGHSFEVVSEETLIRDEITMQPNTIARTHYEVQDTEVDDFDALCVVSGNMADTESYWTNDSVLRLLRLFRKHDKVMAAICCSVPTLAPIIAGVKVSFFPLVRSRRRLSEHGAILQSVSLTVDQRTVTAENQMFTQLWGEEICNMLEGKEPAIELTPTWFKPKGRERRMPAAVRAMIDEAKENKLK